MKSGTPQPYTTYKNSANIRLTAADLRDTNKDLAGLASCRLYFGPHDLPLLLKDKWTEAFEKSGQGRIGFSSFRLSPVASLPPARTSFSSFLATVHHKASTQKDWAEAL